MTEEERLTKLEAEVIRLRAEITEVSIRQARNIGLLAGGVGVLTVLGGILGIGKLLMT